MKIPSQRTKKIETELSMLDCPLMLLVKLPVVDRIHPQSNEFATGVENKATGDLRLKDSPAKHCFVLQKCHLHLHEL